MQVQACLVEFALVLVLVFLLGRGWYFGSCHLGVSFDGGFGISRIVGTAL